jgi:hypothetical protein
MYTRDKLALLRYGNTQSEVFHFCRINFRISRIALGYDGMCNTDDADGECRTGAYGGGDKRGVVLKLADGLTWR